ncbi:AAA family ATPase [Caballeronia sp. J97]|uniref:AAA family ATPase n=1 Tax=Caballeronia sp. J97 TaxID=2805429 RepID=UPI002AB0CC54|nr:AAA family ATPase [Caballeronia sp. J97]
MDEEVLRALLPNGEPLEYERQLWDYKLKLPSLASSRKPTAEELAEFNGAMAEVMKDVAAFYNSFGGYIVAGVRNSPRDIVGFSDGFDCDELNKRFLAATGQQVECCFRTFTTRETADRAVGILFIPQRGYEKLPAQFGKDAPEKPSGKRPYGKGDIYFRFADQCIRAESSEHFAFLFAPGKRAIHHMAMAQTPVAVMASNLADRDPGFIEFVGREDYLGSLWKWFLDKYNSVKLLAGIGGVGKTTLAHEFCDQVASASPFGFHRIIWLSAKRQFYTAVNGQYVPSSRVDFADVEDVLRTICLELGALQEDVPLEAGREALMDRAIDALRILPALVVVDDIDSLEPDLQQDLFHTLISLFAHTAGKSVVGSRAVLTARLDLGAAPGQVLRVKGLDLDDFCDFVEVTSAALSLPSVAERNSKQIKRFHEVTEGSPTFASSVLRLVSLGETLDQALTKWKGADGEDVRRFAFDRELDQLPDATRNVLFALCVLTQSTLAELSTVLSRSVQQVRDDFAELRKYHLLSHADVNLPGGALVTIPGSIRMMRDLLRLKVRNPKKIEADCVRARKAAPVVRSDLGPEIRRVTDLWNLGQSSDALDVAELLDRKYQNRDIKCLLGRAYQMTVPPDFKKSEIALRKAHELGCQRAELLPLWVTAKSELGDWTGLLEITKFTEDKIPASDILINRADAYQQLAEMDRRAGNLRSAAQRYAEGGREIDDVLKRSRAARQSLQLKQFRREVLISHVELIERTTAGANDYLDVWLAAVLCYDCFVRSPRIIRLGAGRLSEWWAAVERRDSSSAKSQRVLEIQLRRLRDIIVSLRAADSTDAITMEELESIASDLDRRSALYTQ